MPAPRKPKPWRGFPSINALHGLRMRIQQSSPNPAQGEVAFTAIGSTGAKAMGTVPAGAFIATVTRNVETAFASSATIDMGVAAGGTTILTSAAFIPGTVTQTTPSARVISTLGAGASMPTVDTEIWVTMGTAVAATGCADILLSFYVNKD